MPKDKEKYGDFFKHAEKVMPVENRKRADARAKSIIRFLRLAEARKQMGLRQVDVDGFSQAEVSKIEHRDDIKLSTLIEYMQSIGMGLKIIGIPENDEEEFEILTARVAKSK